MTQDPAIAALVAAAVAAADSAHAPYSLFRVGAALLIDNGSIVTASNFENASYGLSLCAETVALASANSQGKLRGVVAVAVAGGPAPDGRMVLSSEPVTPCGRCRQILNEAAQLGQRDLPIHCAHESGYETLMLSDLLPRAFGPANLGID